MYSSIFSKIQTDVKTTNLEEMRIAMETYYEEVHLVGSLAGVNGEERFNDRI